MNDPYRKVYLTDDGLTAAATSGGGAETGLGLVGNSSQNIKKAAKFAQEVGDGGLVKGVLAHVAALAGVDSWVVS